MLDLKWFATSLNSRGGKRCRHGAGVPFVDNHICMLQGDPAGMSDIERLSLQEALIW